MKEVFLKTTEFCRVTLDKDVGYIIRPIRVYGAVISVTIDGNIRVGQSQNTCYPRDIWVEVQKEIQCGISYMAKVRMVGWNEKLFTRAKISTKDYTNNSIYVREDGFLVWYIGDGVLRRGSDESVGIIYANFPHIISILNYAMCDDTLILQTSDNDYIFSALYFNTGNRRPTNFIERSISFPSNARAIAIGDIHHVVARWEYREIKRQRGVR